MTAAQIDEHFSKFDGVYKQWGQNHAVLHFQMRGKGLKHMMNGNKADRLFTFVRGQCPLLGDEAVSIRSCAPPPLPFSHFFAAGLALAPDYYRGLVILQEDTNTGCVSIFVF